MKSKKVRRVLTIIATLFLVIGIGLVLFPPVSNTYGKYVAKGISDDFETRANHPRKGSYADAKKNGEVDSNGCLSDGTQVVYDVDIKRLKEDSIKYNNMLKKHQREKLTSSLSYVESSLKLSKYGIFDGVYGYLEAPTIDMKLPIYLGTARDHLNYGAAHLTYTSLPIGGKDTNAVLAGHTGYVGRIFFDNIRQLNIGDKVKVRTYWSKISYKVTGTKVIKPNHADDIFIHDDKDMIILMTCISNGSGGFDRYLVFCER